MRLKLLLLLFFVASGVLSLKAQYDYVYNPDTIRNLVISEARMDEHHWSYIELSNVGSDPINLGSFELGNLTSWTLPWPLPDAENADHAVPEYLRIKLPNKILWPGDCFVAGTVADLATKMVQIDPERWEGRLQTQEDIWDKLDLQLHIPKTEWGDYTVAKFQNKWKDGTDFDSVSPYGASALETWSGRDVFFIRQHLAEGDSIVVDEVNGDFSRNGFPPVGPRDVAGVENATATHVLVRKYSVKEGDLFGDDWQDQVGVDIEDSQWIPIPRPRNGFGKEGIKVKSFWTIGNHGDYHLSPQTFTSDAIEVNFTDTVMTVPWGTRNDYNIMNYFNEAPGIAWSYDFSPNREDSAFSSARTGDVLNLYVCGNSLELWHFDIVVAEPTDDANIVIPKNSMAHDLYGARFFQNTQPFHVTEGAFGMDTIYDVGFNTRIDTLLKYLEKAPEASWVVETVDGVERPDLKDGDKLVVTAKNGAKKTYYIKVDDFLPSHNAYLSSITWPDIPDFYRGLFGWVGDTIPGFSNTQYDYTVSVPPDVDGVPALIAKPQALNTKVDISRLTNLYGSKAERTIKFLTTAEDDSTTRTYSVTLEKEKATDDIQPFFGEPFFSQRAMRAYWGPAAWEVCNPGNQPLDLSGYMIVKDGGWEGTPAAALEAGLTPDDWGNRYSKYIPGYVWQSEAEWQVQPGIAVYDDGAVDPWVQPGDVFVMAALGAGNMSWLNVITFDIDVDFWNNPWGDTTLGMYGTNPVQAWWGNTYYLFKIKEGLTKDSILNGWKPVGDPNDFELIDVFGYGDGTRWEITDHDRTPIEAHPCDQVERYIRKPHIWHGNTEYGAAFGDEENNSEYTWENRATWGAQGIGWDTDVKMPFAGLGVHTFDPVTVYRSFITSSVYKVSPGYTDETIKGVVEGTTVDQFLLNINKEDQGQVLTVKSGETALAGTDPISNGDILEVVSANGENTTQYVLEVSEGGLNNDAELTSDVYTVSESGAEGTIEGIAWNALLADVLANVALSDPNASLTVVDENDKYVSTKSLMYDSTYTNVLVNDQTFFEVVAEDGKTTILYKLVVDAASSDAYVTSSVYWVDQEAANIMFVPRNTAVTALLANLVPAPGATVEIIDKLGNDRVLGDIYQDDKVVVTAADGVTVKTYYLSMLIQNAGLGEITNYLAYVLSDVYTVDQVAMTISGDNLTGECLRTTFLNNLIPAMGATVTVLTADNIESTSEDLNGGDKVQVTAMDGETVVIYAIHFAVSANDLSQNGPTLYPNPTTGRIYIDGMESGNRIRVFNAMGAVIHDMVASSSKVSISLDHVPAGMYLVTAADTKFKVIKK